jgi:endonuclease/exonuclease/phosphatase family metal-dependent hydrolase
MAFFSLRSWIRGAKKKTGLRSCLDKKQALRHDKNDARLSIVELESRLVPATILGWEFNALSGGGPSPYAADTVTSGITVATPDGLARGAGLGGATAGNAWGANAWDQTSEAAAISTGDTFTFGFTVTAGGTVSLNQFNAFNIRRSGTGPQTYQIQYSVDGGTTYTDIFGTPRNPIGSSTAAGGNAQAAISLSGIPQLQNISAGTHVMFRGAMWGGASAGTAYLNNFQTGDDFVLDGTVNAVGVNTTTSLNTVSPLVAAQGQTVTFTGAVVAQSGSATPTGTIQITNGATVLASTSTIGGSGVNGTFSISTTAIPAGDDGNLQAVYVPTGTFAASNSATFGSTLSVTNHVSVTSTTTPYTQDFDTLGTTVGSWSNENTIQGWSIYQDNGAGAAPVTPTSNLVVDAGTGTAGAAYNYGSTTATDRAVGGIGSNTYGGSEFAVALTNNTGATVNLATLKYNGEQWRDGGTGTPQSLTVSYGIAGTFTGVTTWTAAPTAFNFTSPVNTSTAAAVDGNVAGRVNNIGGTIDLTGVGGWAAGQTLWVRWVDLNDAGNDSGLGIDDVKVWASAIGLTITSSNTTTFSEGAAGTFTPTATAPAGDPTPTIALTSVTGPNGGTTLPSGVTFTNGVLSGTPAAGSAGVYTIVWTASNGGVDPSVTQTFTFAVTGHITVTSATTPYTQNFDSLTGTSWINEATLPGWSLFIQPDSPGALPISQIGISDGTSTAGSFYSFGATGGNDQALGGIGSGGAYFGSPLTGSVAGWIAVALTNSTGATQNTPRFTFDGEQWRDGGAQAAQSMNLQFGFGTDFNNVTTWNNAPALFDWSSPVFTSTTGVAVVGNSAGLVASVGGTLDLTSAGGWASNTTLWLRWVENNDPGNDHGLAIDNFAFTASSPGINFTSSAGTLFTEGAAGTFTVSATGNPTITFTETGALPAGVTFVNGVLSGTPNAGTAGTYPLVITAQNGIDPNVTQNFLLTVNPAPQFVSVTSTSAPYAQNFDTLTAGSWLNGVTLPGWYLYHQPNSPNAVPITNIAQGTGSSNAGSFYSFGSTASSDRALGGVGAGSAYFGSPASGSVAGWMAVGLTNSTGGSVTGATITFDGEQWRDGGSPTPAPQSMVLEYGFGSDFNNVTWTPAGSSFNWSSPIFTNTGGGAAVDGNSAGKVGNVGGALDLSATPWSSGSTLWLRWVETNDAGNDHGLAIDNFSFVASTGNIAPTFTSATQTSFVANNPSSFNVTAFGSPSPTITLTSGSLPSGVTFANGVLSGTPTQTGTFPLVFTAANTVSPNATQNFTLTVSQLSGNSNVLRVVDYNIRSASGAPATGLDTILQAIGSEVVNGGSRQIDVLALQEVQSQATTTQVVANLLNTVYSTNVYAAGTQNGATTGSGTVGIVYNSSVLQLVNEQVLTSVVVGSSASSAGRQPIRYKFHIICAPATDDFYVYNSHYKAGSATSDKAQRDYEATQIRADSDALGDGANILYVGDYNIQSSNEASYQTIVSAGNGQAVDPIGLPGAWHNSSNPSIISQFTQAPSNTPPSGYTGGGLDDRFDFVLASGELSDGSGIDYVGNTYHAFGNNGSVGLNGDINSPSSTALTGLANRTTVLNLLTTVSDHLPVVADFAIVANTPASTSTALSVSPGTSVYGQAVTLTATVTGGIPAGETITFKDGTASLGTALTNASGVATLILSNANGNALGVGSHTNLTAVFAGNANFAGSTSTAQSETVSPASTTTNVTPAQTAVAVTSTVTLNAQVTPVAPGAGTPTGTVTFFVDGVQVGTPQPVNGSGQASTTTTPLGVGPHAITATYNGDGNFNVSTSTAATIDTFPNVSSVTVNGNDPSLVGTQRSRVTNLVVLFDQAVTLGATAISLALHNPVSINGGPATTVGTLPTIAWNNPSADGKTWIVTFSGAGVTAGSIADGVYDLNIDHNQVALTSNASVKMSADYTTAFHRLFGDLNGDAKVNSTDNFQFRNAFGTSTGNAAYRAGFDVNNDGNVNSTDNFQFRNRFGTTWVY